jgi:hypothetical protein
MLPNMVLNDRGMGEVLVSLESDCLPFIEEVCTITNRESIRSSGCLIHPERLPFLTSVALLGSKNMTNVSR